ncbi:MAG: hypothetical protein ACRD43_03900 [Pyrinomonadaceae bacterium]
MAIFVFDNRDARGMLPWMSSHGIKLKQYVRISFAGFLAVWLSGVVFLFCCEKINARTSESDFCPLAGMSDDCPMAKPQNANAAVIETTEDECNECCDFLPVVFDKSRKVDQNQKALAAPSNIVVVQFTPQSVIHTTIENGARYTRVASSNKIFVINCVFRI